MALFPFLLFILNLIAFIPIENFDAVLFNFIELLPQESQSFFTQIFDDIRLKQRAGLLSSVFLLSIILTANGVSSIFQVSRVHIMSSFQEVFLDSIFFL